MLYNKHRDYLREKPYQGESYRHPFRVDYSRLLHSSSFRRLQGKTQLFPGIESDFFRNRLTHSLEVAQISKSIALMLNDREKVLIDDPINTEIVEFAALAHDLGHPPFGHNGEKALDSILVNFGGYEGNAQTLRILTKIEKKEKIHKEVASIDENTHQDNRLGLKMIKDKIL